MIGFTITDYCAVFVATRIWGLGARDNEGMNFNLLCVGPLRLLNFEQLRHSLQTVLSAYTILSVRTNYSASLC
jgi:hypothetical protein